jgi:hypothetical protein
MGGGERAYAWVPMADLVYAVEPSVAEEVAFVWSMETIDYGLLIEGFTS